MSVMTHPAAQGKKKMTEGVAFYLCRAECERKGGPYIWSSVWMCMVQADKRFAQSRFNGGEPLDPNEILSQPRVMSCTSDVFLVVVFLFSFYLVKRRPKADELRRHESPRCVVNGRLSRVFQVPRTTCYLQRRLPSICYPDLDAKVWYFQRIELMLP
jgi:hypothetical protein